MMNRQKDCCPELPMGTRRISAFLTTKRRKGIQINRRLSQTQTVMLVRPEQRRVFHLRWTMVTNMKSSANKRRDQFFGSLQNLSHPTLHFVLQLVMSVLLWNPVSTSSSISQMNYLKRLLVAQTSTRFRPREASLEQHQKKLKHSSEC